MNKRGQALIEFVLILPVLLLILFAIIDFGRIISCRLHLEDLLSEVILIEDSNKIEDYLKDDQYHITYREKMDKYKKITLETKIELITPGLKNILSNPYHVKVERSIIYES